MKKTLFIACLMFILNSCQDDSLGNVKSQSKDNNSIPFNISVISLSNDHVYHLDVDTASEEVSETDLTSSNQVVTPYRSMHINGTQVSFVYHDGGKYSAIVKDLENQNVQSFDLLCLENSATERYNYATAIEDFLLLFTESGEGEYRNLSVWTLNLKTGICDKISFGRGIQYWHKTLVYENGHLLVDFPNDSGSKSMAWIDLTSGEVKTKQFEQNFYATLNDAQVHMFYCYPNKYEVYSPYDWSLLESRELDECTIVGSGLFSTQFDDNQMLIDIAYPQPSPIHLGPGIYDLNSAKITEEKKVLFEIISKLRELYPGEAINLTSYTTDLKRKSIVVGYENNTTDSKGGVVFTNFEGELIKNIPLKYVPKNIIITEH